MVVSYISGRLGIEGVPLVQYTSSSSSSTIASSFVSSWEEVGMASRAIAS